MIYSILILTAVILLFFWVVKQHKKTQKEFYINNNLDKVIKQYENMKVTPQEIDALCAMASGSGKITKQECKELLDEYGNAGGAMRIFTKIGGINI